MWDLWCTTWHWNRFLSKFFGFCGSVSFHCCSIYTHVLSQSLTMGPLVVTVPQRHSPLPLPDHNKNGRTCRHVRVHECSSWRDGLASGDHRTGHTVNVPHSTQFPCMVLHEKHGVWMQSKQKKGTTSWNVQC